MKIISEKCFRDLENFEQIWKKEHNYIETRCITLEGQIHDLRSLLDKNISRINRQIADSKREIKDLVEQEIFNVCRAFKKNFIKYYEEAMKK